jgi:hypothetical protein
VRKARKTEQQVAKNNNNGATKRTRSAEPQQQEPVRHPQQEKHSIANNNKNLSSAHAGGQPPAPSLSAWPPPALPLKPILFNDFLLQKLSFCRELAMIRPASGHADPSTVNPMQC